VTVRGIPWAPFLKHTRRIRGPIQCALPAIAFDRSSTVEEVRATSQGLGTPSPAEDTLGVLGSSSGSSTGTVRVPPPGARWAGFTTPSPNAIRRRVRDDGGSFVAFDAPQRSQQEAKFRQNALALACTPCQGAERAPTEAEPGSSGERKLTRK